MISISIYLITFVLAYSFIWEKTYRAYIEVKYEATVIGYQKELVKTQSFKGSSYYDRPVFFPRVKYINNQGEEVIKTLDITTNNIIPIGESIVIGSISLTV